MILFDHTFSVAVLKEKCKELGIPCYGRKIDLIKRLNSYKDLASNDADQEEPLQLVESESESRCARK